MSSVEGLAGEERCHVQYSIPSSSDQRHQDVQIHQISICLPVLTLALFRVLSSSYPFVQHSAHFQFLVTLHHGASYCYSFRLPVRLQYILLDDFLELVAKFELHLSGSSTGATVVLLCEFCSFFEWFYACLRLRFIYKRVPNVSNLLSLLLVVHTSPSTCCMHAHRGEMKLVHFLQLHNNIK